MVCGWINCRIICASTGRTFGRSCSREPTRASPVRQQAIPKPGGGERWLGIPTVLDRFIQQAVLQVLQPPFDSTFSEHAYGFRPGRRAHDAILAAQCYVQAGCHWVVDIDLEKFFDRVNHDVLMGRLAKRIADKRMLLLIRRYLEADVMANEVAWQQRERASGKSLVATADDAWTPSSRN